MFDRRALGVVDSRSHAIEQMAVQMGVRVSGRFGGLADLMGQSGQGGAGGPGGGQQGGAGGAGGGSTYRPMQVLSGAFPLSF
jgi:hypothetical protein